MNAPSNENPDRNETIVSGSDTAVPEAENEKKPSADGSCVVKWNVPGVGSNRFPETVPTPSTATAPEPWEVMEDEMRSNVNPSTDQKLEIAPELNGHGWKNVTPSPADTNVARSPSTACTCGKSPGAKPCHSFTVVAVPAEPVSRVTVPAKAILPVIPAAWACWPRRPQPSNPIANNFVIIICHPGRGYITVLVSPLFDQKLPFKSITISRNLWIFPVHRAGPSKGRLQGWAASAAGYRARTKRGVVEALVPSAFLQKLGV
jgi:hypothetical protein